MTIYNIKEKKKMKATYSDVKNIIENTDWESGAFEPKDQPTHVHVMGYFASSGANWAYQIGIAKGRDGKVYEVVTVFGEVKRFFPVYLPETEKAFYDIKK